MTPYGLPTHGLTLQEEVVDQLLCVHVADWREEAADIDAFFENLGNQMPEGLQDELRALDIRRISRWLNGEIGGDISITPYLFGG